MTNKDIASDNADEVEDLSDATMSAIGTKTISSLQAKEVGLGTDYDQFLSDVHKCDPQDGSDIFDDIAVNSPLEEISKVLTESPLNASNLSYYDIRSANVATSGSDWATVHSGSSADHESNDGDTTNLPIEISDDSALQHEGEEANIETPEIGPVLSSDTEDRQSEGGLFDKEEGVRSDEGEAGSSEDDGNSLFAPKGSHRHHLRQGPRTRGLIPSTWLDCDASGDYDPSLEVRKRTPRKSRRRYPSEARVRDEDDDEELDTSDDPTESAVKSSFQPASLMVPVDDQEEEDDNSDHLLNSRELHNRVLVTAPLEKPILTGLPSARGCWPCYDLGLLNDRDIHNKIYDCSITEHGATWPCHHCQKDGRDCDLITPPAIKMSCEECKRRMIACSYAKTTDRTLHKLPCSECHAQNHHCVAGPKHTTQQRISLDNLPVERIQPKKERVAGPKSTTEQRISRDNLPAKRSQPTKKVVVVASAKPPKVVKHASGEVGGQRPVKSGQSCGRSAPRSVAVPAGPKSQNVPQLDRPETIRPTVPKSTERPYSDDHKLSKKRKPDVPILSLHQINIKPGTTTKRLKVDGHPHPKQQRQSGPRPPMRQLNTRPREIITSLCHPVAFNHKPMPDSPCHFCHPPIHAILGLGFRSVTIIDDPKAGMIEIKGGHGARGKDQTRLCISCTLNLMKKLVCRTHDIRKIHPNDLAPDLDFGAAFDRLNSGNLYSKDHWCSICPSLAEHRCCTKDGDSCGCGLMLCWQCEQELTRHKGNFDHFLAGLAVEATDNRPFGLRADVELLRDGGPIDKFLLTMG